MTPVGNLQEPLATGSYQAPLSSAHLPGLARLHWFGIGGYLTLAMDVLYTRLRFPRVRLIRRPAYIRGRRWMDLGDGLTTGRGLRLDALALQAGTQTLLTLGKDVQINDYVHIAAVSGIRIGDRVLLASKVFITDHNHGCYGGDRLHSDPRVPPANRALSVAQVSIEEDVWLGEGVTVLPGVTIGKGSIVGSMSVVSRDIPAYCIAVGSPARVVKRYCFDTAKWKSA